VTRQNPMRDLQEWFKGRPAPTRAALLGILILGMLGLFETACEPTREYSLSARTATSPAVTLPSATAISGGSRATLSPASQATATGTPAPSVPSIYGTVFHDWNGNGERDSIEAPGEPALSGIRVCLDHDDSGLCASSDESGQYLIEEVPPGDHILLVDSDRYSYFFPATAAAVALELQDAHVTVAGRTLVNIGLGEGPLTLPFLCEEMDKVVGVSNQFDVDPRPGKVRDWMGRSEPQDGYTATTFELRGEVQVVASTSGVVTYFGPDAGRYVVELSCDATVPWFPAGRSLWLYYYGLDEVLVAQGDRVTRGQTIGRVAHYGSEAGRLLDQFSLRAKYADGYGSYIFVDPFRDTQRTEPRGLWTRVNDPACF